MERIDIELIDMKYQKVLEGKAFVELRDKTLRYKAYILSDQIIDRDDPSLGMEECKEEWDIFIKKESIIAIDLDLGSPKDYDHHWVVMISVLGRGSDISFYFKFENKSEAIKIQKDILIWLFGQEY